MKNSESSASISNYFNILSKDFTDKYKADGVKKHTKQITNYFSVLNLSQINVLEVGCGIGGLLFEFLKMGSNFVIGFDMTPEMIKNAKDISAELNLKEKTYFDILDYSNINEKSLDILNEHNPNIIIADRVFCCSSVAMEILKKMLNLSPEFIVLVLPRKNYIFRRIWRIKSRIHNIRLGIKSRITVYYYTERDITQIGKENGYKKVYQNYRYVWETLIYKKVN